MAETGIEEEIEVSAERLWELVGNFGYVPWIPGGDEAEVEGEGVGMVRSFLGGAVREQLESLDHEQRELGYTILEGLPVPVSNYRATMKVSPVGADSARLGWSCTFEPQGIPAEEAAEQIRALYTTMIGWIKAQLGVA